MKQEIKFSRVIWDQGTGTMVARDFALVIDTEKIKPTYLHKARANKGGSAKVLNGAIVIKPK